MIVLLLAVFVLGLYFRFPIAFSLGLSCMVYFIFSGTPMVVVPLKMYAGIDVFNKEPYYGKLRNLSK